MPTTTKFLPLFASKQSQQHCGRGKFERQRRSLRNATPNSLASKSLWANGGGHRCRECAYVARCHGFNADSGPWSPGPTYRRLLSNAPLDLPRAGPDRPITDCHVGQLPHATIGPARANHVINLFLPPVLVLPCGQWRSTLGTLSFRHKH